MALYLQPLKETITMVFIASFFAFLIGFPLGILLFISPKKGLKPMPFLNLFLNTLINLFRSLPFFILIILLLPLSMLVLKTKIGTKAVMIPLALAASPFAARLVDASFKQVDSGLIEMGKSFGASKREIILKILLPEALPALIANMTLTIVNIIGLSAMAGAIGGGGLGDLAMRYGYYKLEIKVMLVAVIIIVALVQLVEKIGQMIYQKVDKKNI